MTVLFTPDEEVGTPSTRDIIEAEAVRTNTRWCRSRAGRQCVVTGRYAIGRFNLEAIGKPSHAGATPLFLRPLRHWGDGAPILAGLNTSPTADCTFSVGIVHGGQ